MNVYQLLRGRQSKAQGGPTSPPLLAGRAMGGGPSDSGPLCTGPTGWRAAALGPAEPGPEQVLKSVCLACSSLVTSPPGCDHCSLAGHVGVTRPILRGSRAGAPPLGCALSSQTGCAGAGCARRGGRWGMRGPGLAETPHLRGGASQKLPSPTAAPPLQSPASSQRGPASPSRPPPRRAQPEPAPASPPCSRG